MIFGIWCVKASVLLPACSPACSMSGDTFAKSDCFVSLEAGFNKSELLLELQLLFHRTGTFLLPQSCTVLSDMVMAHLTDFASCSILSSGALCLIVDCKVPPAFCSCIL